MGYYRGAEVLSVRFITVMAHLFALVVLSLEKEYCLMSALRAQRFKTSTEYRSEYLTQETWFDFLLGLSYLCAGAELLSLWSGNALVHTGFGLVSSVFNAFGSLVVLWFAMEAWRADAYIWVFACFSAITGGVAFLHNVNHLFFKSTIVRRLDIRI